MAITVNIYYTGKDNHAKQFACEMMESGTVQKIRNEPGNLRYEYFIPMDDDQSVLLIDSWLDQASIDLHHQSDMMQTILILREKYDLHMKVERYVGEEEIPAYDQTFIKK